MGSPVPPIFPFAPDSTIVRFVLPRPLAPWGIDRRLRWGGTPARPQCRAGRDARGGASILPVVSQGVVYDRYGWEERPLYPAGEFYGEFGSFLVDLDMPEDQVVGATGVPVCGDPGSERANRNRPARWTTSGSAPASERRRRV